MKRPDLRHLPLAAKLTLTMTAVLIIAVAAVTLFSIQREQETFRGQLEDQAELALTTLSVALADPLLNDDVAIMQSTVEDVNKTNPLVSGQVYDAQGRVTADSQDPSAEFSLRLDSAGQQLVARDGNLLEWKPDKLEAGRAVIVGSQRVGAIKLSLSTAPLDASIEASRNQGILAALLASIGGALLALLLSRSITGPLQQLTAAARRVAEGDLTQNVQIRTGDEVAVLANTFNSMTAQLRQTLQGLEERVRERTRELGEANATLQKNNQYLAALQETSLGLVGRLDVNDLLQAIVSRAGGLLGTENGYVYLLEPGDEEMEMRVGVGAYTNLVGSHMKPGVGLAGTAWESQQPVVVDDYRTWSKRLQSRGRDILRAVVGMPLKSGDQVIGVLGLAYLEEGRVFGKEEMQVLNQFAALASIALDSARLFEQTRRLAEREQTRATIAEKLYGAANVKGILRVAAEELRRTTGGARVVVRLYPNTNGSSTEQKG